MLKSCTYAGVLLKLIPVVQSHGREGLMELVKEGLPTDGSCNAGAGVTKARRSPPHTRQALNQRAWHRAVRAVGDLLTGRRSCI
jgi:hypothetical protein